MNSATPILGLILPPMTALSGWERWQGRNMSAGSRAWLGQYGEAIFWCLLLAMLALVLTLLIRRR